MKRQATPGAHSTARMQPQGFLAHTMEVQEAPCKTSFHSQGLFHWTVKKSHVNAVSAMDTTAFMGFYYLEKSHTTLRIEKHHHNTAPHTPKEPKCQLA